MLGDSFLLCENMGWFFCLLILLGILAIYVICFFKDIILEVLALSVPLIGSKDLKIENQTDKLPSLNIDIARIHQVLQSIIISVLGYIIFRNEN